MKNRFALALAAVLVFSTVSLSRAGEKEVAVLPEKEVKEEGFEIPKKGPLVSELREDLSDDVPGAETVVRIYEDMAGNRVKESMINGAVFQIQVTPFHGFTYILMDTNGDGLFETRFNGHEPKFVVPQWVIFRF